MATVKELIKDGWIAEDGNDGFSETRVFDVLNISGAVSSRMYNALNANGIPARGSSHPIVPGIKVTKRSAAPLDIANGARVSVFYSKPSAEVTDQDPGSDPGTIEVGASAQSVSTTLDVDNNQLLVSHTITETDVSGAQQEKTDVQGVEVNVQVPQVILTRTRVESSPPTRKAREYVGKVNKHSIWGFGKRRLLCTRIQGTSNDQGVTYAVTYEFQSSTTIWDPVITYIDKETGRPPTDLVFGVGIKNVQVYPEADFSGIGITF